MHRQQPLGDGLGFDSEVLEVEANVASQFSQVGDGVNDDHIGADVRVLVD